MNDHNGTPAYTHLIDLASEVLGGKGLEANDEFFARKEGLISTRDPIFKPDEYTDRGKWMDGWETRRRRSPGHDWCILQLAVPGVIRGVDVDTSHFIGNHPPHISIEAAQAADVREWDWTEIIPKTPIDENSHNYLSVASEECWEYVRLNIYPDGGVARLRVFGTVVPETSAEADSGAGGDVELSAIRNGGRVVACSDQHFGSVGNLLLPDAPENMGGGWETKRRRGPGHDWVILQLGSVGILTRMELDTTHFKGNYPDRCSMDGCLDYDEAKSEDTNWSEVLPEQKLRPDSSHSFTDFVEEGPFSHVRMNIIPDGGVARVRIFGRNPAEETHE